MTIQERIADSERRFKEAQERREQHLKSAEDEFTEMTKLQGEWRILQELLNDKPKKVNSKATVIDAVPEVKEVK